MSGQIWVASWRLGQQDSLIALRCERGKGEQADPCLCGQTHCVHGGVIYFLVAGSGGRGEMSSNFWWEVVLWGTSCSPVATWRLQA